MQKDSTSGFSLIQVLVVQGVALTLLGLLLPVALQSSKVAATSASRSSLQSLTLQAKFSLSDTNACKNRVVLSGLGAVNVAMPPPPGSNELSILDSTGAVILKGSASGPGFTQTSDFSVQSVQLQVTHPFSRYADLGTTPGNPGIYSVMTGTETRYLANIVVTAQRNSVGGVASFLGSGTMVENIPVLFQLGPFIVPPAPFEMCTTRGRYLIALGPLPLAANAKSALECIDRDGIPTLVPGVPSAYYVCQIPYTQGNAQVMFPNGCLSGAADLTGNGVPGVLYSEGWTSVVTPSTPAGFIWCI